MEATKERHAATTMVHAEGFEPLCAEIVYPSEPNHSPSAVVQAQLDAYNARDIDALLATYAPDAEQYVVHGARLAKGHAQMRERFLARFAEPNLRARLVSRTVMGNIVIDLEMIDRTFPEGAGTLEMPCIYEVTNGRIQRASFATGEQRLVSAPRRAS